MSRYSTPNTTHPLPDASISEADYLAYLIDECELNNWQKEAFPSMLAQLRSGKPKLSEKQLESLQSAVHSFRLNEDVRDKWLYRGYGDKTIQERIGSIAPSSSPSEPSSNRVEDDDMDDEIPF